MVSISRDATANVEFFEDYDYNEEFAQNLGKLMLRRNSNLGHAKTFQILGNLFMQ